MKYMHRVMEIQLHDATKKSAIWLCVHLRGKFWATTSCRFILVARPETVPENENKTKINQHGNPLSDHQSIVFCNFKLSNQVLGSSNFIIHFLQYRFIGENPFIRITWETFIYSRAQQFLLIELISQHAYDNIIKVYDTKHTWHHMSYFCIHTKRANVKIKAISLGFFQPTSSEIRFLSVRRVISLHTHSVVRDYL